MKLSTEMFVKIVSELFTVKFRPQQRLWPASFMDKEMALENKEKGRFFFTRTKTIP